MIKTITQWEFVDEFKSRRPDNFSRLGLLELFDYLEEIESDQMQPMELDVIAICCEYSEYESLEEFQNDYGSEYESIDDIERETEVIRIDDESFIIAQF